MRVKIDNNLACVIRQAVLVISNSLDYSLPTLDDRYKVSISYIYKILSIIYCEKNGILPDRKLHRHINFTNSLSQAYLLNNIIEIQLKNLDLNNIFSNFSSQNNFNDEQISEFIKILRKLISLNTLKVESFGYLYEFLQEYKLTNADTEEQESSQLKIQLDNPDYKYIMVKNSLDKKRQGSFFTPPELIDRLINSSLAKILGTTQSLNELINTKILDPACGGGNILLRIYNELYSKAASELNQSINSSDLKRMILKNCIYGIDIDEFACEITKLSLFLVSGHTTHFDNIINKNFLIESPDSQKISDNNSRFSLIIGNPPYLNIQNIEESEKKYYLEKYKTAFRRFDIYLLFIEKAIESYLKPEGLLAFIIPDKFLTQSYAKKARQLILESYDINEIISYNNQNLFKNAVVAPIIIVINNRKSENNKVKTAEISNNSEKINYIQQKSFKNSYNFNIRIGWNIHKQEVIEIIQEKSFPLQELCYVSWGAQPGNTKKFIFNNLNKIDPDLREFAKPLIKGGNIDRYNISYSGDYILYLTDGNLKLHRPAFKQLFECPKIVFAEVTASKGILACTDRNGFYTNHSVINCIHKKDLINIDESILNSRGIKLIESDEIIKYKWQENENAYTRGCRLNNISKFKNISLNYALSIINSRVINFYFKNFLSGNLNVFPELVRFLPVFDLDLKEKEENDLTFFQNLLQENKYEEISSLLKQQIYNKDYRFIHNSFSLIADRLLFLKKELCIQKFKILDNILGNTVLDLYSFNQNQINLIQSE